METSKNYYDILGISKSATDDEIKKAYHKLSLKYHPDKQMGKTEEERKLAEEKFKDVNEAYETLSDPNKRKSYDNPKSSTSGFGINFEDIFNSFGGDIFGNNRTGGNTIILRTGKDLSLTLNIDIEDIYNGFNKTLKYKRNIRCPKCGGEGGKTIRCSKCKGTGSYIDYRRTMFGMTSIQTTCPICGGRGKIVTEFCSDCNGTGLVSSEQEITLNLSPDKSIRDGIKYKFAYKGSESPDTMGPNGSMFVTVVHNYDKEKYFITPQNDIIETVKVPYTDILLGCNYTIKLPNGKDESIFIKPCLPSNSLIEIPGKGIAGGKYFSKIVPSFPDSLSDEQKDLVKKLM